MTSEQPMPRRMPIDHRGPSWIDPAASYYFITMCLQTRGHNRLATPGVGEALIDALLYREDVGQLVITCAVVMPDHVHVIITPQESLLRIVGDWKRYTSRRLRLEWQRGFFEHRLRTPNEVASKSE